MILHDYQTGGALRLVESAPINAPTSVGPVLCTLEGPLLSFIATTRNKRLYPRPLWEKIIRSDYAKEMLATKTFFCEADHPFKWEDRMELHMPYVAANVRNLWINEATGEVWGTVDILDTPNGRIIKTFVEYGSVIGISSRGRGNTFINDKGIQEVDVDSYVFVTFDLVPMPGNKVARLHEQSNEQVPVVNGATDQQPVPMKEALSVQLQEAIDRHDIDAVQCMSRFLEYSELGDEFSTLTETVHEFLHESNDPSNTITETTDDLLEAMNMISKLENDLKREQSEKRSLQEKVSKLTGLCRDARDTILNMTSNSDKTDMILESYKTQLNNSENTIRNLRESLQSVTTERDDLKESYSSTLTESVTYSDEIKSLENQVKSYKSKVNHLVSENSKVVTRLVESHEVELNELNESHDVLVDTLNSKIRSMNEKLNTVTELATSFLCEYASVRCGSLGLDTQLVESLDLSRVTSPSDIDNMLRSKLKHASRSVLEEGATRLNPTDKVHSIGYSTTGFRLTESVDTEDGMEDLVSIVSAVGNKM